MNEISRRVRRDGAENAETIELKETILSAELG